MEIDLDFITEKMDELKDKQARLKFELKQTEQQIGKYELQLQTLLDNLNVNDYQYGNYTFGWKIGSRTAFNQSLFKEKEPDLFEKYKVTTETKQFVFKIA